MLAQSQHPAASLLTAKTPGSGDPKPWVLHLLLSMAHHHYRLKHTLLPWVYGEAIFHETSPWCQSDWGLLPWVI